MIHPLNKWINGYFDQCGGDLAKEGISLDNSLEILRVNQDAILNFPLLWTGIYILFKIF